VYGIDDAVDELDDARCLVGLDFYAFVLLRAFLFVVVFATAVVEFGEAVEVGASALEAFPDTQQASLAHRDVVCPDGHGVRGIEVAVVEALLVVVEAKLVHGYAFGEEVVGDEAVEQVVLAGVVVIVHGIGVVGFPVHPGDDVLHGYLLAVLAELGFPELVGLGKEGEAVLAMLGCFDFPAAQLPLEVREGVVLVECLVAFVPDLGECVDQSAGFHELCHDAEVAGEVVGELVDCAAHRLVARVDDVGDFVDEAVDGLDVAVGLRHGADAVDSGGVEVFLVVGDAYLAVGHRGDFELLVRLGEFGGDVCLLQLCAVEDTVQHDDGADAVLYLFVGEGVPAGFGDDALDDEGVQIELDGLVGGGEAGVVAVGRHELVDGGLAHVADSLLLQQPQVFAELRVVFEVAGYGTFREDIAGGGVDGFGTCCRQDNQCHAERCSAVQDKMLDFCAGHSIRRFVFSEIYLFCLQSYTFLQYVVTKTDTFLLFSCFSLRFCRHGELKRAFCALLDT